MRALRLRRESGDGLVELLLSLSIVAIVLIIFGPDLHDATFGQGHGRSKVSRVRYHHRSIATAIEAYYVDHDAYPAMRPLVSFARHPNKLKRIRGDTLFTMEPGGLSMEGLTTPVAYITTLTFPDPFAPEAGLPFAYWTPPDSTGWILLSPGPDKKFNFDLKTLETVYVPSIPQPSALLLAGSGPRGAWTYDPTNGTESAGDLWRVKQ